uniref:Uncharacterized protein n=1 Tax=Sipha flava TaxID=143950 RepID=A0A2S2QL27_9HEMI
MDSSNLAVLNETHNTDKMQEALSCMTVDDFNNFLNVYQLITSMDPRVDQTMSKASVDQLLSGELLNQKRFDEVYECVANEVEETESTTNGEELMKDTIDDCKFLNFYDHIDYWKKRMLPMINKIEDLAQESKMIAQTLTTVGDVLKSKESTFNVPLEQKKNEARYSSNIGKYIETGEHQVHLSKTFNRQAATDDDVTNTNNPFVLFDKYYKQIPDKFGDVETMLTLSPTHEKNPRTLLTPSSAYLKVRPTSVVDELEVKTYFID